MITSRQHEIVRTYRRAARGGHDLALVDGWHLVQEAVSAAVPLIEIALVESALPPACQPVLAQAVRMGARLVTVSATVMDALSPVRTPSGVVALVRRAESDWSALRSPATPLVVMAIGLQDPGNAGALIRAAEAGGATGVVLAGESADPWGWKALRASMGSTFRLPVVRVDEPSTAFRRLREAGIRIVATAPRTTRSVYDADMKPPTAIVLGGEGSGLDTQSLDAADETIHIPMQPPVESLNVAVAAALVVYEATRQRASVRGDSR